MRAEENGMEENGMEKSDMEEEIVIEEILTEEDADGEDVKAEMGKAEKKRKKGAEEGTVKKRNPFRMPLVILGILLLLLAVGIGGGSLYLREKERQEEALTAAAAEWEEERKTLEETAREEAQKELERRLGEARMEGYQNGEKEVLDHIQMQIASGMSIVEVLRLLYTDQLVVASGGQYHFIPINDSLKKNDYQMEHLSVMDNGELRYMENGEVTSYKGVDVSKFQGKIDWQKVAQDGVTFAFIRAGYRGYGEKGTLMEDELAAENLEGATQAGIKTGVYFYTQAITKEEAVEEAGLVLELIAPYRIECPVVIDVERVSSAGGRMNALDAQTRTEIVKTFCETIAAAGYRPMVYHNLEMGAVLLDIAQLEEYDKWFAYYKEELYYPYAYQVWQYSDKGRVQGITGDVDLNIAFTPIWE